jgi:type IV secretory pathway VirB10-like protein
MKAMRVEAIVLLTLIGLTLSLGACAAKAQVRTETPLPLLDPPPPPPRVVANYAPEPEPVPLAAAVEPSEPARPPVRPPRTEQKPEPTTAMPEPAEAVARPQPPSLTLTPSPGSESQTAVAIRNLITKATRDLARVNTASLNNDGRAQYETARRFIEQAEYALRTRNIVFAGKLADKAATMAAVLVR